MKKFYKVAFIASARLFRCVRQVRFVGSILMEILLQMFCNLMEGGGVSLIAFSLGTTENTTTTSERKTHVMIISREER